MAADQTSGTCTHCADVVHRTYRLPDGGPIPLCQRHYQQATKPPKDRDKEPKTA